MIKLNTSTFPKELNQIDNQTLTPILKKIKADIEKHLKNLPTKGNQNHQNALKRCLLLSYFLLKDKVNFEQALKDIKFKEHKTGEKAILYFDLLLIQSKQSITFSKGFPDNIAYDKLVGTYAKWHLLFPNLLKNKYERQIKQFAKSEFKVSPTKYLTFLELLIDWLHRLPAKADFLKAVENKLSQHNKSLTHFWDSRTFDLASLHQDLSPVKVAVWDTGVDPNCITNISSDLFLSYDENCQLTQEPLMTLNNIGEQEWQLYKGFADLKAARKSAVANYFLKEIANYEAADMIRLRSIINQVNIYSHGTTVASVAGQRISSIEIVPIRVTFDTNQIFPTLYTVEWIEKAIKMHQEVFSWLQQHQIPIVNISWNHRAQDIETSLMNTGVTHPQERKTLAKKLFADLKESLYEGITNCPVTLFVVGAGNSNSIVEEEDFVPSSFQLPNVLSIGAVNHQGKRTGFTSIGKNVQLYANGSYVDTVIPNGSTIQTSGTSIAAPQVCNLAAMMLSIRPTLSVLKLKQYMLQYADRMLEENILVLHPKRTIEQLLLLKDVV